MAIEVQCTKRFHTALNQLPSGKQKTVLNKIRLLIDNPNSSSLNAHRYESDENAWECYVDHRMRLIYEKKDRLLCLKDLGYHSILDKAYRRSSTSYAYQLALDEELLSDSLTESDALIEQELARYLWDNSVLPSWEESETISQGTSNYFHFFQNFALAYSWSSQPFNPHFKSCLFARRSLNFTGVI